MAARKTTDTATENKKVSPDIGYVIVSGKDGTKFLRHVGKGCLLGDNEVFASPVKETACAMAGVEFEPYTKANFSKETLDEFAKREKTIKNNVSKIDKSLENIAFDIYWINTKKAYVAGGYDNIVKYAEAKFGYSKTTCYEFIGIVDRFAKRDEKGVYLEEFDPIVKGYSTSKLSCMIGLTNEQITAKLKPTMSVRDIKAAVKAIEEAAITDQSAGTDNEPDTGEDTAGNAGDDGENVIDSTAREVITNTIISYKGAEDYMKNADYQHIGSLIMRVINAHPEAVIEISYTLPEAGKGA